MKLPPVKGKILFQYSLFIHSSVHVQVKYKVEILSAMLNNTHMLLLCIIRVTICFDLDFSCRRKLSVAHTGY